MYLTTRGLVLRETDYKESSRILTVLTEQAGKITVSVRGAVRKNSRLAAQTQFLACSELTLFYNHNRYMLTEARTVSLFPELTGDIKLLSLAAYFAELLDALTIDDAEGAVFLQLGLGALQLLCTGKMPPELVKAVFELRVISLSGLAPLCETCAVCGKAPPDRPALDLEGGTVVCAACAGGHRVSELGADALLALRHIVAAPPNRVFSFKLDAAALAKLKPAAEQYLLTHLDRKFGTLEYYKSL
jgi:DNA repair protein RecO (recombination protein O)